MKKLRRLAALWMTLALLLSAYTPSRAAVSVYFVAVNDQFVTLEQETMPFWSDGRLYVSDVVFSDTYKRHLGITSSPNQQTFVLFTARSALTFDLAAGQCYDNRGSTYSAAAVERSGHVFFPLDTVCTFFGLTYSYIATSIAPVIRIKSDKAVLSDFYFIDSGTTFMRTAYNAYLREIEDSQAAVPQPVEPVEPDPPEQGGTDVPSVQGQRVALAVLVTEEAAAKQMLTVFTIYQAQGTFLLTPDQAETMPDLVRSLVAGGQTLALRADTPQEIERGQEALWRAACVCTGLVFSDKGAGTLRFDLDFSALGVNSDRRAETVLARIAARQRQTAALLGTDERCGALSALIRGLRAGENKIVGCR